MNKQNNIEFRFYEIPQNEPILALVGDKRKRNYGHDVHLFHFHNLLEIGYCYYGSGKIIFGNDELEFSDEMFSIIPKNLPHHTISDGNSISYWEFFYVDTDNLIKEMYNDNLFMVMEMSRLINKRAWLLNTESHKEIASLLLNIRNEMIGKRKYYKESVSEMLKSLFFLINRLNQECIP